MPCNDCPVKDSKSKKSHKKHSSSDCSKSIKPCEVNCCEPETKLDCCAIPYQRLEKVRNGWSFINATGLVLDGTVYNRSGSVVAPFTYSEGNNTQFAYKFVNSHRYLQFEECGKLDQVIGWYVNLQTGQLALFQDLCEINLTTDTTRSSLLNVTSLSSSQKQQLHTLNHFYKVSKRAVDKVGGNSKEEGNIVAVTDKHGQKWLIAINRDNGTDSVCDYNCAYAIVAIKLC
jgi:hypothetical protein